jgi:hypothetical protein
MLQPASASLGGIFTAVLLIAAGLLGCLVLLRAERVADAMAPATR